MTLHKELQASNDFREKVNYPLPRWSSLSDYATQSSQPWNNIHISNKQQIQLTDCIYISVHLCMCTSIKIKGKRIHEFEESEECIGGVGGKEHWER